MGGQATRRLTAQAITTHRPNLIVLCGFGGALTAEPPPTEVMVATACWRFDPAGPSLHPQPFPAAVPGLSELLSHLQTQGVPAQAGNLITTPGVIRKHFILPLVGGLAAPVLDLEGVAVAAAAREYNLPFLAVRAVTDGAGEDIQDFLARIINTHQGVPLARLGAALLVAPQRLGYLLHLRSRARRAGLNLARAISLILEYLSGSRDFI